MGHSDGNELHENVSGNTDSKDCAHDVSEGNRHYQELKYRSLMLHFGKAAMFCLCPQK